MLSTCRTGRHALVLAHPSCPRAAVRCASYRLPSAIRACASPILLSNSQNGSKYQIMHTHLHAHNKPSSIAQTDMEGSWGPGAAHFCFSLSSSSAAPAGASPPSRKGAFPGEHRPLHQDAPAPRISRSVGCAGATSPRLPHESRLLQPQVAHLARMAAMRAIVFSLARVLPTMLAYSMQQRRSTPCSQAAAGVAWGAPQ